MRIFAHSLWLLAPVALGSVIIEPVPTLITSCEVNYLDVPCGAAGSPTRYGLAQVGADATSLVTGLGTTDGLRITIATTVSSGTDADGQEAAANGLASLDFLGFTDGPERMGFATFLIVTDGDHGYPATSYPTGMIEGLGSCAGFMCHSAGTLVPFELGSLFEIAASVRASNCCGGVLSGAGAQTDIRLHLFELDGTPVAIFDPPAPVPEPGTAAMIFLPLAFVLLYRLIRRQPALPPAHIVE